MGRCDYERSCLEIRAEAEARREEEAKAARERRERETAEFEALPLYRVVDRPGWTGLMRQMIGRVIGGSIWTGSGYADRGVIIATHADPVPEAEREKDRACIQDQIDRLEKALELIPR